jgi:glycolate oxidase FAD binding subunit
LSAVSDSLPITETATPETQADVAQALRDACAARRAVYPIGGGTSLDYGLAPKQPGLGLSLGALQRVIDYPSRDLTITVEAGITIAELTAAMAAEGQQLPIDLPQAQVATLGGTIATNWSGARRYGYGTLRDYIIGISAVDGRGTPFKAGGRVVKNVAGYDFCKLLTGSLGTLGVITQVTLKAKPRPQRSAFAIAAVDSLAAASALLDALASSATTPVAIELIAGIAWSDISGELLPAGDLRIVVGLEGTTAEVDWMRDQLACEWRPLGQSPEFITADQQVSALWTALNDFSSSPAELAVKINVLPSRAAELVGVVRELDATASIQAHAGNGIVLARFNELPPGGMLATMVKRLQPAARAAGGSAVILSANSGERTAQAVWGSPAADWPLMRAVKKQFDPHNILNPGRFVY